MGIVRLPFLTTGKGTKSTTMLQLLEEYLETFSFWYSKYLHFADNSTLAAPGTPEYKRLGKIQPIIVYWNVFGRCKTYKRCQYGWGNGCVQRHINLEALHANETSEMRLQGVDAGWCRHWVCVCVWSLHWEERLYSLKRTWTRGCQSIVPSNTTQVPLLNTYTWKSAHPVVGERVPPLYLVTTAHGCSIRNLFWIDHCVTWPYYICVYDIGQCVTWPYHICAYNVGCLTK